MIIRPLPAFNGDAILVSFQHHDKTVNILIDGGVPRTYQRALKPLLKELQEAGQPIDLLVVTHIDDDHIGGIKALYEDTALDRSLIKRVWFNSGKLLSRHFRTPEDKSREVEVIPDDTTEMSVRQGLTLEAELEKQSGWVQQVILAGYAEAFYGAEIKVLSPREPMLKKLNKRWETEEAKQTQMSGGDHDDFQYTIAELLARDFQEDTAVPNGSAIAFLITLNGLHYLFLADAHPSQIEASLRALGYSEEHRLCAEFVKVSHHASKFNTSPGLLDIIRSPHFFVSTDGGAHGLPNKEPLARIIAANPGVTLHFNYEEIAGKIFSPEDYGSHTFTLKHSMGIDYLFEG
ncbi:MBL fold metallo-hydrolase [Pedobacter sp. HMF7647]|uniref:MBL fold metallo-hydrolase n=1 Tax=Hufsiella arboris TaxID=2695275 RepID=A0A7K1YBF3_9SPHI|nr:MBL fold metallo-hydrolase [Hufsiella arboris]MXV51922.1 MBL fold metallo-hydrolase [Hufsiella arboris]